MTTRQILRLKTGSAGLRRAEDAPDVTYKVEWNEKTSQWDTLRNDANTQLSRKKRQSAVALAIRLAKAEQHGIGKVSVFSLAAGKAKIEWSGSV
jgi:hypothetical protein